MQKERLICTVCTKPIIYGKQWYTAISDHMKTRRHVCPVIANPMSSHLPGTDKQEAEHSGLYGFAAIYCEGKTAPKPTEAYHLKTDVHYLWKSYHEEMLLSFIDEKNLSFFVAGENCLHYADCKRIVGIH